MFEKRFSVCVIALPILDEGAQMVCNRVAVGDLQHCVEVAGRLFGFIAVDARRGSTKQCINVIGMVI